MAGELTKKERYLRTVRGEETDRPPIWIMRQAGRYMPEYMAMREHSGFRDFCLNPEISAEASMLPLKILDVDILIIFNDILIPLEEMGLLVEFPDGGPQITNPVREAGDLDRFQAVSFSEPAVAHSIQRLRQQAGPDVPVLGFCGAPFTLAAYAVEGKMSRHHHSIKRLVFEEPDLLEEILGRIADTAADYLVAQIQAGGADGVQIFESWAGLLAMPHDYERFAAKYQRRIVERVRAACGDVPIHLFARSTAGKLASMEETGADVLSVDWSLPLAEARRQTGRTLQGNMDPAVLTVKGAVERELPKTLKGFDWERGWIANLGHGVTPNASPEEAKAFVRAVKALSSKSRV